MNVLRGNGVLQIDPRHESVLLYEVKEVQEYSREPTLVLLQYYEGERKVCCYLVPLHSMMMREWAIFPSVAAARVLIEEDWPRRVRIAQGRRM